MREASEAYVAAWRANDATAVLATLTDDAVIMPAGSEPITGKDRIRAFWFPPEQPPTIITEYVSSIEDLEVSGTLAYVRGRAELAFTWEQDGEQQTASNYSAFLMVLRRTDAGWKIARRMWGRLPEG